MIAIEDIFSIFRTSKGRILYASKGERLKLVSKRGHVLIVENTKGLRFPVNEKLVTSG